VQPPSQAPAQSNNGNILHTWTTTKKTKVLELLINQNSAGHATDNRNLKKEGWTIIMSSLNKTFKINLTCNQIKNQKNVLQGLFYNYKFLCNQSGFGWDNKTCTVTADQQVWDELIQAHP